MGLPIISHFIYLQHYRDKLYQLIYNNYFFYIIIENDEYEMLVMEERLRYLFSRNYGIELGDHMWNLIWENVLDQIYFDYEGDRYLYL